MNCNGIEYDKEQLKENLIRLEEKFRKGQIGEGDYRTTKEKYQPILYEYELNKLEANSFKHEDYNYGAPGSILGTVIGWIFGKLMIKRNIKGKKTIKYHKEN